MIRRITLVAISLVMTVTSLFVIMPAQVAHAAISACSATMTPHQVDSASSNTYQFTLTNNDPDTIQWIRISRPNSQFTLTSASASGWSASLSSDNATYTGGGLDQGDSLTLRVNAQVSASANGTYNWALYTSDDPGGSGQFACDGDLSVTVGPAGGTVPAITNVSASGITTSAATIKWTTDRPAKSQVSYGKTSSYGSSTTMTSTYVTSHSVSLSGLSASTGYHYKVTSVSEDGGTGSSGDNTFTTSTPASSGNDSSDDDSDDSTSDSTPTNTIAPIQSTPTERTPPTIQLTSSLEGFYKEPPKFTGTASDNVAIASIEYSIDGGTTWLPADRVDKVVTGSGRRQVVSDRDVTFEFTPINLEDGDYMIVARATDTSSNQGSTSPVRLVIDMLAPQVGGSMVSIGPQTMTPRQQGVITSVTGIDQKFTISAVGGPTDITLTASVDGNPNLTKKFSLAQTRNASLWSGILSFENPGTYNLEAMATDGAGNITRRAIGFVHVAPSASVIAEGDNEPLADVETTVHYFVPQTNSWAVWDGAAYGQDNPQKTDEQGRFQYLLPAGKYYLELKKPGRNKVYSRIFTLDQPSPLTSAITMDKSTGFSLGKLPLYLPIWSTIKMEMAARDIAVAETRGPQTLLEEQLPSFELPTTDGNIARSVDLIGKPSLVTFVATWSPLSKDQLQTLSELQQDDELNVLPVAIQEPVQKVNAYLSLAGYDLSAAVDRDGVTVTDYELQNIPVHLFLDTRGFVKKVMVGVLSEQEIRESMVR